MGIPSQDYGIPWSITWEFLVRPTSPCISESPLSLPAVGSQAVRHHRTYGDGSVSLTPFYPEQLCLSSSVQILEGPQEKMNEYSSLEYPHVRKSSKPMLVTSLFSWFNPDLSSSRCVGTWVHPYLMARGECRTCIRWAVSNSTTASGKQNSLAHFSWPSLPNHPRLQLMCFWKVCLLQVQNTWKKGIKLTWWLGFHPRRFFFKNLHMFHFIVLLAKKGIWTYGIIIILHLQKPNSENYFYTHIKLIYSLKGPD